MLVLVTCKSIRESMPDQLELGSFYFADSDTLFNDGEDTYVSVYKDIHKKDYVGNVKASHFEGLEHYLPKEKV